MVGRILWCVFGMLLVLLLTALLRPVRLRIRYQQGELQVTLHYLRRRGSLYPRRKPTAESPKKLSRRKKTEKNKKKKKNSEKKAGSSQKKHALNAEQLRYTLEVLPPVFRRAFQRTGRRICIEPLTVHVLVATDDPADTAMVLGKLEGGLAVILPVLHQLIHIEEQDIQLFPDFCAETMDYFADVGIRIRPIDLLVIALSSLGGFLRWRTGFQKRADVPETPAHPTTQTTASTETTACVS